jgi:hypothetical protein
MKKFQDLQTSDRSTVISIEKILSLVATTAGQ